MAIVLRHGARVGFIALIVGAASCGGSERNRNVARSAPVAPATLEGVPRSERPVERPAIGGGPRDPDQRFKPTLAKIAAARCDREMRCGNVGPNEKYPSREACVTKNEADKRGDINASECTLGVSQTGLLDCLRAIRDEDCGNPLDTVARLNACRSGNVCLK
jgi:hypothetical protein